MLKRENCSDLVLVQQVSAGRSQASLLGKRAILLSFLVLLAHIISPLEARADALVPAPSVSLAWDRNPESDVVGYRVYYGPASRRYTNSTYVGNATTNLTTGLSNGATYFFAVTALDATGLESDFSKEVVSTPSSSAGPLVQVRIAANRQAMLTVSGSAGTAYDFLATTNLSTWAVLGSATVGPNGLASFTDTSATNYGFRYYRARQK